MWLIIINFSLLSNCLRFIPAFPYDAIKKDGAASHAFAGARELRLASLAISSDIEILFFGSYLILDGAFLYRLIMFHFRYYSALLMLNLFRIAENNTTSLHR